MLRRLLAPEIVLFLLTVSLVTLPFVAMPRSLSPTPEHEKCARCGRMKDIYAPSKDKATWKFYCRDCEPIR